MKKPKAEFKHADYNQIVKMNISDEHDKITYKRNESFLFLFKIYFYAISIGSILLSHGIISRKQLLHSKLCESSFEN